ncbi:hypothetical protein CMI47_04445 [Candidatus Pacearchaeota archaeon]|jgi:hypothetical protein|nr:hypothetical protein [Candidatus Pacearchaeota archaeon]|tara:strand:+ start:1974 stop:2870 length:897 start_codon:yes stop_codon:yes gene_type:complete
MPAQIVPELDDSGQPLETEADLSALEAQPPEKQVTQPEIPVLDGEDIPEKYRGKSAADLLEIVQNQESHIGRQGTELGELRGQVGTLRGLVDQSLALREDGISRTDQVGTEDDLTDDQFITDPRDAVTKTVKRETRDQNERLARLEQQNAALDFSRKYPEAQKDVESPEFVGFVQKSRVRGTLAHRAFSDMENIDFNAAEELWELWEDYKSIHPADSDPVLASQEATSQTVEPTDEPKAVPSMVTQGSSGDVGGSTKPIYSQAALNRLQVSDPDTYWADDTQRKIDGARAEGRVVDDT